MAWIESHQELARHPKTKKFARQAGITIPAAVGHLHMLWWWAMDYAQDGNLSSFDPDDIADAMLWDGASDKLLSALVHAGFIDSLESNLFIHDWDEYAGRMLDKRRQNTERKRKSRESHARQPQDNRDGHGATVPNITEPNTTTTTRVEDSKSPLSEPEEVQTMMDAHHQVFGTNVIPSNHSKVLIPIMTRSGEAYAIELILEAGEAAKGGAPSIRYVQEIDGRWQKDGVTSRAEAKAKKPLTHIRGDPPKNRLETQNEKTMREIREAEQRERTRSQETLYAHSECL